MPMFLDMQSVTPWIIGPKTILTNPVITHIIAVKLCYIKVTTITHQTCSSFLMNSEILESRASKSVCGELQFNTYLESSGNEKQNQITFSDIARVYRFRDSNQV